jgi:hypothetical protein
VSAKRRITLGGIYADILVDRRGPHDIWHYIGQREGSPDILFWGHTPSEEIAIQIAERLLKDYDSRISTSAGS